MLIRSFFSLILATIWTCGATPQAPDPKFIDRVIEEIRPAELRPPKRAPDDLQLRLNFDTALNPMYPFEADLNRCIEADVRMGGIGEPCIWLHPALPAGAESETNPDKIIERANYLFVYWDHRMRDARDALLAGYAFKDAGFQPGYQRGPNLKDYQNAFLEWRLAKCRFERFQHLPDGGAWSHEVQACAWASVAKHALELEHVRRHPSW